MVNRRVPEAGWYSDKLGEDLGMAAGSFYLFFDFIFQLYLSLFPFFSIR